MNKQKLEDDLYEVVKAISKGVVLMKAIIDSIPENNNDSELRYVENRIVKANMIINEGSEDIALAIFHLEKNDE